MWDPRTYRDTDFGLNADDEFEPGDVGSRDEVDLTRPHIMTVLGAISPEDLGVCLPHEHILADPRALTRSEAAYRLDRLDLACEELEAFFTVGGRAMVDVSTPDYGRDLLGLRTIAQRVPIHIVAAAGRHRHLHASRFTAHGDAEGLEAEIRSDLDGPIRPGLIMFGTSHNELTPVEAALGTVAMRTAAATGYPVATHGGGGAMALVQLDLAGNAGLEPGRLIVGRLAPAQGLTLLRDLAKGGVWLSFDRIGDHAFGSERDIARTIVQLADAGYEDRLLVSQGLHRTTELAAYGGSPGWIHLIERFAIELMEAGAGAEFVRRLLVENPARALSILPR